MTVSAARDLKELRRLELASKRRWKRLEEGRQVYFLRHALGPIKIGVTINMGIRNNEFQQFSPWDIKLVAFVRGTSQHESFIHMMFAKSRIRCEWFFPTDELNNLINEVAATGEWPADIKAAISKIRGPQRRVRTEPVADFLPVHHLGLSQ